MHAHGKMWRRSRVCGVFLLTGLLFCAVILVFTGQSRNPAAPFIKSVRNLKTVNDDVQVEEGPVHNMRQRRDSGPASDEFSNIDAKVRGDSFFKRLPKTFGDVHLVENDGVPVQIFLEASKASLLIFDILSSTAFVPVKMDFTGNINKINQKYSTNPDQFKTLQDMIEHEIQKKQNHHSSSATIAVIWMKRSLEFVDHFLNEIVEGEKDLGTAVSNAYYQTLRPFHGWVIRGVFAVASKALPTLEDFEQNLLPHGIDIKDKGAKELVEADIRTYHRSLGKIISVLNNYYKSNSALDINEL